MAIKIIKEKCKACGICEKQCPFDAIHVVNGLAEVNEKCTICGACVEACPFDAIEKKRRSCKKDISKYKGVWVYAEQRQGELTPVVIELLGEGKN